MIKIKRIYENPEKGDGFRILVDRLWPRGLTKEKAKIGFWMKEIAPSTELRKWFSHDIGKWKEFQKKYRQELKNKKEPISKLKQLEKAHDAITLVFSAKDEEHNNAVVLGKYVKL